MPAKHWKNPKFKKINIKINKTESEFVIEVKDSGAGIPKENMENFSPLSYYKENG